MIITSPDTKERHFFEQLKQQMMLKGKLLYLGRILEYSARKYRNKTALVCGDTSISYEQLYWRSVQLSKLLRKLGIQPHERLLLFFENSIEFYIAYFAIIQIGAVVVPLNTFLHDKELAHILSDSKPQLIICSHKCKERLGDFKDIQLPRIVTEDDFALDKAIDSSVTADFEITDLEPEQMVALLYTSGTTGLPKGVMLSSKNTMTNVMQGYSRVHMCMRPADRLLAILPLFHSFSQSVCVWAAIFVGCTVIVVPKIDRKNLLIALMHNPTIFIGVPALYGLLCLMKTAPIRNIRYFVSGGDALPNKISAAFELLYRRKICSGYGLTETAPFVSFDIDDELGPTNRVGHLIQGMTGQLRDEDNNLLSKSQIGELWLAGDNVMLGYYNEKEMTDAVLQGGWLRTGDLVYVDKKNKLVIAGRLKDLIIHKGFNIYPQEIENIILTHPAALRVGVIGEHIGNGEEVPVAYVQVRHIVEGIEEKLKKLCKNNLAIYKIPKRFICTRKELPVTATGKVHKNRLKEMIKEGKL